MTGPLVTKFAHLVPKADLHCHLSGSIPLEAAHRIGSRYLTNAQLHRLATAYGSTAGLDVDTKRRLFFDALTLVTSILKTPTDLRDAVASIAAHGATRANLRYLEIAVNPSALSGSGLRYPALLEGLIDGADTALRDSGVTVRYIASFLRDRPIDDAWKVLRDLEKWPSAYVLGVGLDGPETHPDHSARRFADVYVGAGQLGLRRAAHIAEAPSAEYWICVDELSCDRIDHGYPILDDPHAVEDAVSRSVPFTVCPTLTADMFGGPDSRWPNRLRHPIIAMVDAGLRLSIGTDDGGVIETDIGQEYSVIATWMHWGINDLAAAAMSSLDAAWLDEDTLTPLRTEFRAGASELAARLAQDIPVAGTERPQPVSPQTDPHRRTT